MRRRIASSLVVGVAVLAAGCGSTPGSRPATAPRDSTASAGPTPTATPSAAPTATATATPTRPPPASPTAPPAPGSVPPSWLGKRPLPRTADGFGEIRPTPRVLRLRRFTLPDTVPMLAGTGFASRVVSPAPASVIARSTYQPGCPVGPRDLAWVRLTFRGFDGARHTGELLVNARVADDLVRVFHDLWRVRFPIEEMRVTRRDELSAAPTGDGNNTSAFACRPVRGATAYSQHAYGLAVDVNPFQNPYSKGALVLPELASSYLDRGWKRPGMVEPDGAVVAAFARIGWGWGGSWSSLRDLQHFSRSGR